MMPPSIQVCPIEIPGRGRREQESPISNVADLAQALAHGLPLQAHSRSTLLWSNPSAHSLHQHSFFKLASLDNLRMLK